MAGLKGEIRANFDRFLERWPTELSDNIKSLQSSEVYSESYERIAALNALKDSVIAPNLPAEASVFFLEAQNDALQSHVHASMGAWRVSLQSLRGLIENALAAFYYMDHPVELKLWSTGNFRIGFSALMKYFEAHPKIVGVSSAVSGIDILKAEYATLSKAVHASAVSFWMTAETDSILLWTSQPEKAGMWASREKKTIQGVALLTLSLFAEQLTGTQKPGVRETVGLLFAKNMRAQIRAAHKINLD